MKQHVLRSPESVHVQNVLNYKQQIAERKAA